VSDERRPSPRAWQASGIALALATLAASPLALAPDNGPPATVEPVRIDVNAACADRLRLLEGIGPALAGAIVADRGANGAFRTLEDLDRVPRIGPRTLRALAPDVTLGP